MKLCNTVIISSFNYCPLVWMFFGMDANHKVDRTQMCALRMLHNDYDSSFNPVTVGSHGEFFPTVNNASNSINVWIIAKLLMKYVTCS